MTIRCAAALVATVLATQANARELYAQPEGTCDGFPRLEIGTARGMCAGLVIGPTRGNPARQIVLPRSLLQLSDTRWLVSDLGAWDRAVGAIWELTLTPGKPAHAKRLLSKLSVPHALARGPDGGVYVGEMQRIFRFDPDATDPLSTVEVVVSGLPDNTLHLHRHPLSKFVFAPDGALLVNVGALSDQCESSPGRPTSPCDESETDEQPASIRRYALTSPGQWSSTFTVHAKGLRNSVALAVHSSGTVVQAENSIDLKSRWGPFEELNVIEPGRHYGWPYCMDVATATPAWGGGSSPMDCAGPSHTAPRILLPPHAAPLDLTWYEGSMFPALKGRMLMTFHGHRSVGGRLVTFAVDGNGVPKPDDNARFHYYPRGTRAYGVGPAATPVVLTPGWGLAPGKRPQGSPVGLAVADDGAIWATDDRAGLIIRFAQDDP